LPRPVAHILQSSKDKSSRVITVVVISVLCIKIAHIIEKIIKPIPNTIFLLNIGVVTFLNLNLPSYNPLRKPSTTVNGKMVKITFAVSIKVILKEPDEIGINSINISPKIPKACGK
jgi:hypothetical protein